MKFLRWLNSLRRPARWSLKTAIVGATVLLVCFPYPGLLRVHVQRWRNPNALIEPDAAALSPWLKELRAASADQPAPAVMLARVERFVYQHLPYEFDWKTWGNADYIPTVSEALAAGREDCDGRAVVAASLLAGLGYESRIVTDFAHVWVATNVGETMSPGATQAVVAEGGGISVQPSAWAQMPKALGYGVSPFFLHRELIVVLVGWLMWLRPGATRWRSGVALALMIAGLLLLRRGGRNWQAPIVWLQILGVLAYAVAAALMWKRARPPVMPDGSALPPQVAAVQTPQTPG
ncbi:MAG: transglutaminase domain-containing protein [Phycisphaerales bacterium]|nr:transglutaminase domain-containing protein [Phycisphaerales bacterium]